MWQNKYNVSLDEVPIGHVTNGIHLLGWMSRSARDFWQRRLKSGAGFYEEINSREFWSKAEDPDFISDEELWALRYRLRRELIDFTRSRLIDVPKLGKGILLTMTTYWTRIPLLLALPGALPPTNGPPSFSTSLKKSQNSPKIQSGQSNLFLRVKLIQQMTRVNASYRR